MSTSRFVEQRFGKKTQTRQNPVTASVATTVTKVLNNNPDRVHWILVNLSANDVFVTWDNSPSSTRGVKVAAGGGALVLDVEEDGELVAWEANAIASVGAADVFVVETELQ